MNRREFIRLAGVAGGVALMPPLTIRGDQNPWLTVEQLVCFPEKTDLILRTDRPPQLETPVRYFQSDLTPNGRKSAFEGVKGRLKSPHDNYL